MGVFQVLFSELAIRPHRGRSGAAAGCHHRQSPAQGLQPQEGGAAPPLIGRTQGGLTSKLHVVCHKQGRPVRLLLSQGQCSDFTGADLLLRDLPDATTLMEDKGYDSDKIRTRLLEQGITPCIPSRRNRNKRLPASKRLYKMGHTVGNLFAKLKDWRPSATRYHRRAPIFLSAVLL
ncbi:MAG: IS5 family transposase, partial [Synechococcus sp. SB0677_bin_5]|nr:IS5 family transposase [Synechococcus sp. SB0677_bin_5]